MVWHCTVFCIEFYVFDVYTIFYVFCLMYVTVIILLYVFHVLFWV